MPGGLRALALSLCLACVASPGWAGAIANPLPSTAPVVIAPGPDGEPLVACVGSYMQSHPLDLATGARLIELGLASELKARALAAMSPQSTWAAPLSALDAGSAEDVSNMLYVLTQELAETGGAVDRRPYQLVAAVFYFYTARLAGPACTIAPGYGESLADASYDQLAPWPGLGFDGLRMQREIDQTALCAFGHFAPHAKGAGQVNGYLASHADLAGLRADASALAASRAGTAAQAAPAPLPDDAGREARLTHDMGLLLDTERDASLPMALRYRAAALAAYHLAGATGGSCKLGKAPLKLIGKE